MAAAKKVAAKKAAAPKKEKAPPKPKFGSNLRLIGIPEENPRREGTKAHGLFAEMQKFMKKNPKASLADVIAGAGYRRNDYEWDLWRETVKTAKAFGATAE